MKQNQAVPFYGPDGTSLGYRTFEPAERLISPPTAARDTSSEPACPPAFRLVGRKRSPPCVQNSISGLLTGRPDGAVPACEAIIASNLVATTSELRLELREYGRRAVSGALQHAATARRRTSEQPWRIHPAPCRDRFKQLEYTEWQQRTNVPSAALCSAWLTCLRHERREGK